MVLEAHGGAHDVGGPTADFKCKEVAWAGLAEATFVLHDRWGRGQVSLGGSSPERGLEGGEGQGLRAGSVPGSEASSRC